MGLDQSVYAVRLFKEFPDFVPSGEALFPYEMDYWSKCWSLQHWMKNLYREKGGTEKDFNGVYLRLTMQDLERLDRDSSTYEFYEYHSTSRTTKDEKRIEYGHLKEFISGAKENINRGYAIYYYSSW